MTLERLARFGDAWRRKDVEALMEFMTDDCEFRASVGPEPGTTFRGRDDVRRGFELMLRDDEQAEARSGHAFIDGDVGVAQWSFGDVRGCDVFEFDGDLIKVKDAYRKVQGTIDS